MLILRFAKAFGKLTLLMLDLILMGQFRKESLVVLSGLFTNLSATWLASIPIVSILAKDLQIIEFLKLLTMNGTAGIVGLMIAIWLLKKEKDL